MGIDAGSGDPNERVGHSSKGRERGAYSSPTQSHQRPLDPRVEYGGPSDWSSGPNRRFGRGQHRWRGTGARRSRRRLPILRLAPVCLGLLALVPVASSIPSRFGSWSEPPSTAASSDRSVVGFSATETLAPIAQARANHAGESGSRSRMATLSPLETWATNLREARLFTGPTDDALSLGVLPTGSYMKILQVQDDWVQVAFGGHTSHVRAMIGWVRDARLESVPIAPQWAKNYEPAIVWVAVESTSSASLNLQEWTLLEVMGEERRGRLPIRSPGDGRLRPPGRGWIDASQIVPVEAPALTDLPSAYPATTRPDAVRVRVPYRTQLDGSPWSDANCGPTTLGMGLEALGINVSSEQLRREVMDAQGMWGDEAGTLIDALAEVAQRYGVLAIDLSENRGLKRWTVDDVRRHLSAGRPVIVQVAFRALPGRAARPYASDHYLIITGVVGEDVIYNDSIDSDGIGWDRIMSGADLERAMNATDRRYSYAGFALARP